jgi:hypothetical protein
MLLAQAQALIREATVENGKTSEDDKEVVANGT